MYKLTFPFPYRKVLKNILLSEYGIKLAKDRIFANVLPNMLELTDYEEQYMTPAEIKKRGFQVFFFEINSNHFGKKHLNFIEIFLSGHCVS